MPSIQHLSAKHPSQPISSTELRQLCLDMGADDVGFVNIDHPAFQADGQDVLNMHPQAKSVIMMAFRLNRGAVRSPSRSLANREFHASTDEILATIRSISSHLERQGLWCVGDTGHFPMKMDRWPGKVWDLSLKPLAVAAGLGHMGHNRLVLHPEFGGFMFLGALLIDAAIDEPSEPSEQHPCISCKLCVSACPTGAIGADGHFDFAACLTHNYREKLGGFSDWVEQVVEAKGATDYRKRIDDEETASMWQSLSSGANTQCDHCMAVCPAAADEVDLFKQDPKPYVRNIVRPLRERREKVFVVRGSDAQHSLAKRFPRKSMRIVGNGLRARTAEGFLAALPWIFQRRASGDLSATYHFDFTGDGEGDTTKGTVNIRNQQVEVLPGLVGSPDLVLRADTRSWLSFLAKERHIVPLILRRKIRIRGPLKLLLAFGACFP